LARKAASTVYLSPTYSASLAGPTTTPHAIEIPISIGAAESGGLPVRLIDTPGLSFAHQSAAESADVMNGVEGAENTVARDILLRSRGRIEKSKNTAPLVAHIVGRAKQEDLMMFYSLPAYAKDDPDAFLGTLARVSQFTKKVCREFLAPKLFSEPWKGL
jgi:nuclear GTP-binding protein